MKLVYGANEDLYRLSAHTLRWRGKAQELFASTSYLYEIVKVHASDDHHQLSEIIGMTQEELSAWADAQPPKYRENIIPQWLMLAAFTLENVLKGAMVAKGVPVAVKGILSKELRMHDLRRLAARAGLDLTDDDDSLIGFLNDAAVASGRYPIPFRRHLFVNSAEFSIQFLHRSFISLFRRALAHLDQVGSIRASVQYDERGNVRIVE